MNYPLSDVVMSTIRFMKSPIEDVERAALEQYDRWVNTYEHEADVAMEQLDTFMAVHDGLSNVITVMESIKNPFETDKALINTSIDAVLAPVGMRFSDLIPSNEAESKFSLQNFKEMLKRIWRAIKQTVVNIWNFLRKGFSKAFSEHRRIAAGISNLRITMNNLKRALPSENIVKATGADLITDHGKFTSFSEVGKEINQFMNVREKLLDRYAVKLAATMKSILANRGPVKLDDANKLETIRVSTNKILQNFDRNAVSAIFQGSLVIDDETTLVPTIGDYSLKITGRALPPVNDPMFMRTARTLSIDLSRADTQETTSDLKGIRVLTFSEMSQLLGVAEILVNDISRGRTEERSKRIEGMVHGFEQWVAQSAKVAEDWVTANDHQAQARDESLRFFREQASFSVALTAWGGSVFLKMDTLALRVAAAVVALCQSHLKVYS